MNQDQCAYCGTTLSEKKGHSTSDHIPPKSWYTDEEKQQLQLSTVPSCIPCNNGQSQKDEDAKDLINACLLQAEIINPALIEKHRRTLNKNQRLRRPYDEARTTLVMQNGLLLPKVKIEKSASQLQNTVGVFVRIARAIFCIPLAKPARHARSHPMR